MIAASGVSHGSAGSAIQSRPRWRYRMQGSHLVWGERHFLSRHNYIPQLWEQRGHRQFLASGFRINKG